MKNLQLSLKSTWFYKTKARTKPEDYRELNEYWLKRLVSNYKQVFLDCTGFTWESRLHRIDGVDFICKHRNDLFVYKQFTQNTMTLGYPSKTDSERILKLEHKGIEIRTGNPEWGAEEGKLYFVIKHGKSI